MFNKLKTVILLSAMSGLLMLVGSYLGGAQGVAIAFFISIAMNIITYFYSDKIVIRLYKAIPLDKQRYENLYTMVQELTTRMQLPMPQLWMAPTPMANAFATGRNPQHASVVFTQGILTLLEPRELRAVLAHELGHVKNRDILISTIAATLATAIGYLATMARYAAFFSSSRDSKERSSNPLVLLIIALLMPLAAMLIQLAISRSREYLADETGAHTSEDPLALASALSKLEKHIPEAHLNSQDTLHASTAPLFIVHPFLREGFTTLFMTHPPTEKRIERLREIEREMSHR
jgi:heat shock protein HtpX